MSDCCSSSCSSGNRQNKHKCPICVKECSQVVTTTIMYHIKEPWNWVKQKQNYYFCDDPDCDNVYFGDDDSVLPKSELKTIVGIKEKSSGSLLCYCYGITFNDVEKNPEIKSFVIQQTKGKSCACETHNPSGKCCLKDFPKSC